jgi:hypothetical protein
MKNVMKYIFFAKWLEWFLAKLLTLTTFESWEKNNGKKVVKMEALNSVNIKIKNDIFGKKNSRKGNYPHNKWVQISRRF